jgi:hypothetical protein
MAEWNLAYIAANAGVGIFQGLKEVFVVGECVTLTNGTGTLAQTPVANVFVEKADGTITEVKPQGTMITVGKENDNVRVTYQYSTNVKNVTIDAESTPYVGKLVMTADKHNNMKGKVGEVQIEIPSFQLSGAFDISLEASGNATTKLEGDALAVEGDSCTDGTVYAYITEIGGTSETVDVTDIAVTPSVMTLAAGEKKTITVVGIRGGLYSNVAIDVMECKVTSDKTSVATVTNGTITAVTTGTAYITVEYNGIQDFCKVVVA